MATMLRSGFAAAGIVAALAFAVVLTISPRAALELLLLLSPVVITIWLIVMMTGWNRGRRQRGAAARTTGSTPAGVRAAIIARDGGRCRHCGAGGAGAVARRAPARVDDPLSRYVALCAACARNTSLPLLDRGATAGRT